MARDPREQPVLLHLDKADVGKSGAQATGGEPISKNGDGIGRVTSGAYGYTFGKCLALGFVKYAQPGETVEMMILGQAQKPRSFSSHLFIRRVNNCLRNERQPLLKNKKGGNHVTNGSIYRLRN
jgi:glycine cleavage system aminomethyltransferase T